MIERIDIKDVSIAEEIRKQMALVSPDRNGLMPSIGFITRPNVSGTSDYNSCTLPGTYCVIDHKIEAANNPGINYGVLCVFSAGDYILQLAVSVITGIAKIRTRTDDSINWRAWVSI